MSSLQLKREAEAKVQLAMVEQRILEKKLAKQRQEDSPSLNSTLNSTQSQKEIRQELEAGHQKAQIQSRLEAKRSQRGGD